MQSNCFVAFRQLKWFDFFFFMISVLMSRENVELVLSDVDSLPEAFRKSRKGSIYLTPYRVRNRKLPVIIQPGCDAS